MRRAVAIFCAAFAATLAFQAKERTASAYDPTANDCVDVERTEKDDGLTFEVKNKCDRSLLCAVNWTLVCENAAGKDVSSKAKSSRFALATSDKRSVFGSADECKQNAGWRIADVGWNCQPVK